MRAGKRALDLLGALTGLVVLWPLMLVIALLVKLDDGGPVFFRQQRVGRGGGPFRMWKFRTMVPEAPARGGLLTVTGDPRVTRIGAWLRRLKLDELPQLFNVLAGEMSLVGPRPEVPKYVALYTPEQRKVLDLVPGITDQASIRYCDESTLLAEASDPERLYVDQIMPDKIRINLRYTARATLWSDFSVILATVYRLPWTARGQGRTDGRNHAGNFTGHHGMALMAAVAATAATFLVLYGSSIVALGEEWWLNAEAAHGLLLGPLALILAWRRGPLPGARAQPLLGTAILALAGAVRYGAELAASMTVVWISMITAIAGLIVYVAGTRQLWHWWLPAALFILSIPLPAALLNGLALPLQLIASDMGAALLDWRNVPVVVAGNVIHLPGRSLFVTEACSGLRSLTALLALGVLIGGLWLRSPWSRLGLLVTAVPMAVILNSVRVFLTGFLVFYVDPRLGDGFMHYTEGWALFVVAFGLLAGLAWAIGRLEQRVMRRRAA